MALLAPTEATCTAAVVLVPPGLEPGTDLVDLSVAQSLVARSVTVVAYDPRGRGDSGGVEDANGFVGQDDLAAVLRWTAAQERVDPEQVVVYSRSFGAALAAGALGRHGDLGALAWLDYEGPGWLEQDLQEAADKSRDTLQGYADASGDPTAWFEERAPAGLIETVPVPYHRLQGLPDHALGSYLAHAKADMDHALLAPVVTYNGVEVALPVETELVRSGAVGQGLDPDGAEVLAALEDLLAL